MAETIGLAKFTSSISFRAALASILGLSGFLVPPVILGFRSGGFSPQVLYLLIILAVPSGGYFFILLDHRINFRRTSASQGADAELVENHLANHLMPMALLVFLSDIYIGLTSIAGTLSSKGIQLISRLSEVSDFSIGATIIEIFPDVYLPTGILIYAFWGTFIFNCYQYLQRIVGRDFPPSVWIFGVIRLVAAILASMFLYILLFENSYELVPLPQNSPGALPRMMIVKKFGYFAEYAPVIAFACGFFPTIALKTAVRIVTDRLSQLGPIFGKYTYTPLTVIDGISRTVEERLAEAGIDSIQLLSRSNIEELKDPDGKGLPYAFEVIQDWIDQAKLAVYFSEERELAAVRSLGIRTYSGLLAFQSSARQNPEVLREVDSRPIPPERFRTFVLYGDFPIEKSKG